MARAARSYNKFTHRVIETAGANFKYEYSFEEMAELVHKYIPAAMVEKEDLIFIFFEMFERNLSFVENILH